MKKYFLSLLFVCNTSFAAGWSAETNVTEVGVFPGDVACVRLANGEMVKLDLSGHAGKAELSVLLTAHSTGKKVRVYQQDSPLSGGCNSGTSVKPHTMLKMLEH